MPVRITIELHPWEAKTIDPQRVFDVICDNKAKGISTRELMKVLPAVSITAISQAAWQLILDKKITSAWTPVARGTLNAPPVEARYWVATSPEEVKPNE
jgi:hypothetical protein